MIRFTIGQRWVSTTEPELGLGVLMHADRRTLQICFDASHCTRQYSLAAAPVKRICFGNGDTVRLKDGSSTTISSAKEVDGLLFYTDKNQNTFCETNLSDSLLISLPQERLLAGFCDPVALFNLRYEILAAKAAYDASPTKGFVGGQIELLPHQFYIADTVTQRFIPRVLLSDETGLGKTIEACLILHKLLVSHKITRVLIVVPPALLHQWFIELYRKFNLSFMIFSENYCVELEQSQGDINPFLQHQLGLISMDQLRHETRGTQVLSAGWDMLVVDEAHHITDHRNIYQQIKLLSSAVRGLMLLTATPEQMGLKNHFKHLQLIDPDRYFDFKTFCDENRQYEQAAKILKTKDTADPSVAHLLDTFGPGRVIFKNKRSVVKGFPGRICRLIPLKSDMKLGQHAGTQTLNTKGPDTHSLSDDPRIHCLADFIQQTDKILVITRTRQNAFAIEKALAQHTQAPVVRFDESMTLMQRDRHAAFFAQHDGARVLICSEIGSEGRNFQFVNHLFLFDLPTNPELLEQRIGRLDRIGQTKEIHILIPFLENSADEILARWYMDGLAIFKHHVDGANFIFNTFKDRLTALIQDSVKKDRVDHNALDALILDTKRQCHTIKEKMDKGHNLLLELNSFKPDAAKKIIDLLDQTDNDNTLEKTLTKVWDHYGLETDQFSADAFKLKTDTLADPGFPLPEPMPPAMTFKRSVAVLRDELDFITWDHDFVHQTLEYFITNNTGACATAWLPGQETQGLMLEAVFTLECVAPLQLNMGQYLDFTPIRILVDHQGDPVKTPEDFHTFSNRLEPDKSAWFKEMDQVCNQIIPAMIRAADQIAQARSKKMIKNSKARIKKMLGHEIERLATLKKINPGIRDAEIQTARSDLDERLMHVTHTRPKLDSLRLIRVMP